jgi:hypothetical protein
LLFAQVESVAQQQEPSAGSLGRKGGSVRGSSTPREGAVRGAAGSAAAAAAAAVEKVVHKDLVIGMAKGILEEQMAVFGASFRRHVPSHRADVVVFVDEPISERMRTLAGELSLTLQPFSEAQLSPPAMRSYHPSTYRWPMIDEYIQAEHGARYARVLAADVRDTAFQADPFEKVLPFPAKKGEEEALVVFGDDPTKAIGECAWNGGWVKSCYGQEVLARLRSKPIFCSGISMGTLGAMRAYTSRMTAKIMSEGFAECERNGVDQGMHNVLVHEGGLPHLRTMDQAGGWVANLQASPAQVDRATLSVRNRRGEEYAVLHQYDRHSELTRHLMDAYVTWDRSEGGAVRVMS